MPKIAVNEKVPALYLETWRPTPNASGYRVTVLDCNPYATLGHWLSDPVHNVQGRFECCQGVCCEAFPIGTPGAASFQFSVPIYVYYDPTKDAKGEFKAWSLTTTAYKNSFQPLALANDLGVFDLHVTPVQQGQGTRLNMTVVTNVKMRDHWTQEIVDDINKQMQQFTANGDRNFAKLMTPEMWQSTLLTMGYDFVNKCFPAGFGTQARFGGAGGSLAALNNPGYTPPVPQMQGAPAQLASVAAPKPALAAPVASVTPVAQVVPAQVVAQPAPAAVPVQAAPAVSVGAQLAAQASAMPAPIPAAVVAQPAPVQAPPAVAVVPSAIPQAAVAPVAPAAQGISAAVLPPQPAPGQPQQQISPEELAQILEVDI